MAPEIKVILATMGAFLLVEIGKDWLEKRGARREVTRAQAEAKDAMHDARRSQAHAEASEVEAEREARRGKTMDERARDLLGLARDLLNRGGGGSKKREP